MVYLKESKMSLHESEEIIFELSQHMKGRAARSILDTIRKSTCQMIEEQEAVRGRLFTIQDVMQSTVRAWLQLGARALRSAKRQQSAVESHSFPLSTACPAAIILRQP